LDTTGNPKNIVPVNAYVNRIGLPQSTRVVLWREPCYSNLCVLTRAGSHGHLSSRNQSSFIPGVLS
jgi:hypothetical protein